jgi:hypothetical protein
MRSTDEARLARLDVSVNPLVSEECPQRRQRLDRAWMNGIPLRIPRRVGVDIGGYRSITGGWRGGVLVRLAVQAVGHDEDEEGMVEKRDE